MEIPEEMTLARLSVLVMPNGEILCLGRTIGWVSELSDMLEPVEQNEPCTSRK